MPLVIFVVFISLLLNVFQGISNYSYQMANNDLKARIDLIKGQKQIEVVYKDKTCTSTPPKIINPGEVGYKLQGKASWYDYTLDNGWSSKGHYVTATRDFERYSWVLATNLDNGKSVKVQVTDYGPDPTIFPERIIDLSSTAFQAIAPLDLGEINVEVEQL